MAEKDISEKILLSHADVFADCENALIYGGKSGCCPVNCSLRLRKASIMG